MNLGGEEFFRVPDPVAANVELAGSRRRVAKIDFLRIHLMAFRTRSRPWRKELEGCAKSQARDAWLDYVNGCKPTRAFSAR